MLLFSNGPKSSPPGPRPGLKSFGMRIPGCRTLVVFKGAGLDPTRCKPFRFDDQDTLGQPGDDNLGIDVTFSSSCARRVAQTASGP